MLGLWRANAYPLLAGFDELSYAVGFDVALGLELLDLDLDQPLAVEPVLIALLLPSIVWYRCTTSF
ncbi:MAG: hypothetical protein WKH64_12775 [Chloroflexia bacterium]